MRCLSRVGIQGYGGAPTHPIMVLGSVVSSPIRVLNPAPARNEQFLVFIMVVSKHPIL